LAFTGFLVEQQSFYADIFIQIGPVKTIARTADLKLGSLRGCAIR